jgi:NAD-dependent SIR2 family protein deacetylase
MDTEIKDQLYYSTELIEKSDSIVVFAGAGIGVDSGLEQYRGDNGIWIKKININGREVDFMELCSDFAFENEPKRAWAFFGSLIKRYKETAPHDGFYKLLKILEGKEYFVVTSNVDEHFQKAGFDENRIWECHGSVFKMECINVKEKEIWITPDFEIDFEKFEAIEPIPRCPNCGGVCRPNVFMFGDRFWVTAKSSHQEVKYKKWLKNQQDNDRNIIAIEIGAGKTIPTIRSYAECLTYGKYHLIRINPFDAEVKIENHVSIPLSAKEGIDHIYQIKTQ